MMMVKDRQMQPCPDKGPRLLSIVLCKYSATPQWMINVPTLLIYLDRHRISGIRPASKSSNAKRMTDREQSSK
ncbi:hypothetical protein BDZ89DRAFT_1070145 [Hymenopellis radicata]|nr:hypothetical protein BDZ89DRAFT_1070145 [Hymenopellis radicata]